MNRPTKRTVELICMFAETNCKTWKRCHENLVNMTRGQSINELLDKNTPLFIVNTPTNARLIRVIQGKLFYDWPWYREKFDELIRPFHYEFTQEVLSYISDIKDSVFLQGDESQFMPQDIPFPSISNSPGLFSMDFIVSIYLVH